MPDGARYPYFAAWERAREMAFPMYRDDECPLGRLPDGRGFWEAETPARWVEPRRPMRFPYVPVAVEAWQGRKTIVDMGADVACGRVVPGATAWTLSEGLDMRDVSAIDLWSVDLVYCSHAIEHVSADDVPAMLRAWTDLLKPDGEMLIVGPHRCSAEWSPVLNPAVRDVHLWAPAAATVAGLLESLGMGIVGWSPCLPALHMWWVRAVKGVA